MIPAFLRIHDPNIELLASVANHLRSKELHFFESQHLKTRMGIQLVSKYWNY